MSIGLAHVYLDQPKPGFGPQGFQRALMDMWPDLDSVDDPEVQNTSMSFRVGTAALIVAHMTAPVPWDDVAAQCAGSYLWPEAATDLADHPSHLVVTVQGDLPPAALSTLLTKATATVLHCSASATGVTWYGAGMHIRRDIFLSVANDLPEQLPIMLWVNGRVRSVESGSAGYTTGLRVFGYPELECAEAPVDVAELRERMLGIAEYMVANEVAIASGDTIGEDEHARIRADITTSRLGLDGNVISLEFLPAEAASQKRRWWRR